MHKVGDTKLAQRILSRTGKLTSFSVVRSHGLAESNKDLNIDSEIEQHPGQCCSGGYNEVFILENWASYGPRH